MKALRSLAVLYLSQQKFNDALTALEKAMLGSSTEKAVQEKSFQVFLRA